MHKKSIAKQDPTPRIICTAPWRLAKVMPLADYTLSVEFLDGTQGAVKMSQRILNDNAGVFSKLKDIQLFNQVHLEYGVVTWPGEIDLAPDSMYDAIKLHGIWTLH